MPLLLPRAAASGLSFDPLFLNGAVLQQDAKVAVWGRSDAHGSAVELSLDGEVMAHTTVDGAGRWEASLPPQPTSWARTLAVSDKKASGAGATVAIKFGAVVLSSGHSNMGMPVRHWDPCCDQPPAARDPEHRCSCFGADNGTAEIVAAGRYTGKISLASMQTPFQVHRQPSLCSWPHLLPRTAILSPTLGLGACSLLLPICFLMAAKVGKEAVVWVVQHCLSCCKPTQNAPTPVCIGFY